MNLQKNNTLELLKLFASYMVVFIHVKFYGRLGPVMDTLARFAVPFFFLVSGFCSYKITCEKIKKRIRNILTLLIFSVVCCTAFKVAMLLAKGNMDEIMSYLSNYLDIVVLAKMFVFNATISSVHLWYLFAILYVYVIFFFATKFRLSDKIIFIISFCLLLLQLLLGEVLSVFGIALPKIIVRNFLVMGIPFFGLGLFVKKYAHKFRSIPNYVIFAFIIIGSIEPLLSRHFFGENELYSGTLLVLFAVVCVLIKYSDVRYPSVFVALEGCSTYIYIFHIMISAVINRMYTIVGIDKGSSMLLSNIHPILVCICSTIFAHFIIRIYNKAKQKQALMAQRTTAE